MLRVLGLIDDASARIEKFLVLVFLALMAAVVFFDVVYRVSATPEGLILRLISLPFGAGASESTTNALRSIGVPGVAALIAFVFFYGALRTTSGGSRSKGRDALGAVAMTVGTGLAIILLLKVFPNGLVWSQPLALAMLLWVALFGATLATKSRAHIALEVADKIWPKALLPIARLLSGLVAGAFCLMICVLAAHYCWDFVEQWREGVGYISGIAVPKWTAYLSLPVGFLIMGLRFTAYAIGDFRRGGPPEGTGGIPGIPAPATEEVKS